MTTSPAQTIDELVTPLAAAAGLDLWDVEVNPRVVRVMLDRPGGVDLDAVTAVARLVSAALDERDDLAPSRNYQLEVGSPGIERTLRTPYHFGRSVGATVAVKTTEAVGGSRRIQGVLRAADDAGITVETEQGPAALPYELIQKAHTVLQWGPAGKAAVRSEEAIP